jgi:hypothetical protein
MSRDGGWTDFLEPISYGISRRAWYDWLSRQDIHQRSIARPKPHKSPGQKIKTRGIVQIDLVEAKKGDLPGNRKTDTYFFTMVELLTGFLVAKRVDTKTVDPPNNGRGTLIVMGELLDELEGKLGKHIREVQCDDGGEFKAEIVSKLLPAYSIRKRVVPLGATIEKMNGFLQRKFYDLVKQKRGGSVDKLLAEAVKLVNGTTSRITGFRPIDALQQPDKVLAEKYNTKRQAPGKQLLPSIKTGQLVRILKKARKADLFYKSYRDKYSAPARVTKIRGNSYIVNGKSYPRDRVLAVKEVDQLSKALIERRGAKEKPMLGLLERRVLKKRKAEAREREKETYKAAPRRSKRLVKEPKKVPLRRSKRLNK